MSLIDTRRLALRELSPGDAPFILELLNEAGFLRFIGDKGVRTLGDARDYILKGPIASYRCHGYGLYLTHLKGGAGDAVEMPIGICGLVKRETLPDPDVGFAFLARYGSQGYASESAASVLRYGRETLGLRRIVAVVSPENHGSMAVLQKIGLRFERRVKVTSEGPDLNLYGPPALGTHP